MKRLVYVMCIISIVWAAGCVQTEKKVETQQMVETQQKVKPPRLYTAYNIWKLKAYQMKCINFKHGNNILQVGTEVRNVEIEDIRNNERVISFITAKDNQQYTIYFTSKYHIGKTIEDYLNYMFTTKTFEELTEGMSENEIKAIKNGSVVNGMSKEAVLVSQGRPPEHRTNSLKSNVWVYWSNRFRDFRVCFDENDKTVSCR